jgi:hypothetical protein
MSTKHDFISDVSPRKQSWTLVVRVVRAWFVQDYKNKKTTIFYEVGSNGSKGTFFIPFLFFVFFCVK